MDLNNPKTSRSDIKVKQLFHANTNELPGDFQIKVLRLCVRKNGSLEIYSLALPQVIYVLPMDSCCNPARSIIVTLHTVLRTCQLT